MSLYNAVHNAVVLAVLAALGGVTVACAWVLVDSVRDGDAFTAWLAAAVFLLICLLDVWFFFRG
jgi:hypothetical protein